MNKSIFERIFPHSPSSALPQYHDYDDHPSRSSRTAPPPNRISLKATSPRSKASPPGASHRTLSAAPLSASIIHHDDPFLPVERAAKSLQRNIQAFLDAQSEGLNASIGGGEDDLSSVGSPTPTPSVATPSRSHAGLKTVPIRQPPSPIVTLRGARKGLARAMEDYVRLKGEELRIITAETSSRDAALVQVQKFVDKKTSLESEIASISSEDATAGAASLRAEARKVEAEILDLENRLYELRSRHRHLVAQAEQLESSVDSKLSSYKSSLALVEKNVKQFLRQPPVPSSLTNFDETGSTQGGMYALKPDRRTLEMAQEQWTTEQNSLALRKADVENEQKALTEGANLWRSITQQITEYEKDLRRALRSNADHTKGDIGADGSNMATTFLSKITTLISSVTSALATAKSKEWNLLICCLGAELEALKQGHLLLGGVPEPEPEVATELELDPENTLLDRAETNGTIIDDDPPADILSSTPLHRTGSNQSLQDTLQEFGDQDKGKQPVRPDPAGVEGDIGHDPWAPSISNTLNHSLPLGGRREYRSESEDDEPGPDFLIEH